MTPEEKQREISEMLDRTLNKVKMAKLMKESLSFLLTHEKQHKGDKSVLTIEYQRKMIRSMAVLAFSTKDSYNKVYDRIVEEYPYVKPTPGFLIKSDVIEIVNDTYDEVSKYL